MPTPHDPLEPSSSRLELAAVLQMATTPAQTPFRLFKYGVLLITFFTFLAWLLLLGGVSALEDICSVGCRAAYGLPWFIIWFQFILIIPAILVEVTLRCPASHPFSGPYED